MENSNQQQEHPRRGNEVLAHWRAPEFESYEKSARWYLGAAVLLSALVAYALIINSPLMAITFILSGIVGYIHLEREPEIIDFRITTLGVAAGKELYPFENIKSFWIFYDPPHTKTLSLHTSASILPFIHIPLADEDPVGLRETLLEFAEEIKQEPSMTDVLERVLHI